ncbi:MAG: extracellular solute-binding protein [Alphaproteobacteria bacterium]|nr:extracellular solute-binding protein [Alphaproteobacteria bacterium]
MRRTMLAAMAAAMASGGLACGVPFGGAARAGDLTFWTWRQEDRSQYAQLFADFNKLHPEVKIKYEAFEPQSYGTVLSTALAAGKGPDVIHVRAYGGLEQFSRAGYLLPLDPTAIPELGNFDGTALASVSQRSDGRPYAVPFASQTLGLFYNTEIFQRLGLKPPTTWDELIQTGKALKEKNVVPLANGMATAFMVEIFASVFTGSYLGSDFVQDMLAGRATFSDPRYVAALGKLTELRDLLPPGFMGVDYATMQQLFLSGRAAMFAGGSFEIANFRRQNPGLKMDFVAPPAPAAGQSQLVSVFYDGGYAINAKTANQADAVKLVRYMSTKAFGDRFSALLGNISPIRDVQIEDALLAKVARLNQQSLPYIMAVHFRYQDPTGSTLLQGGVQRLMGGQATAAQVGDEITKGIATYFVPFQNR